MSEVIKMRFRHLTMDATTQRIFKTNGSPKWENSLSRWVNIQRTG